MAGGLIPLLLVCWTTTYAPEDVTCDVEVGELGGGDALGQGRALIEGEGELDGVPGSLGQVDHALGGHALHKGQQRLGLVRLALKLLLVRLLQLQQEVLLQSEQGLVP